MVVSDVVGKELWSKPQFVMTPGDEEVRLGEILEVLSRSDDKRLRSEDSDTKREEESLTTMLDGSDVTWRVYAVEPKTDKELKIGLVHQILTPMVIKHGGNVVKTDYERLEMTVKVTEERSIVIKKIIVEETVKATQIVRRPRAAMAVL